MPTTQIEERRPVGVALDVPELRLPLSTDGPAAMPELREGDGSSPFAFRFLVPVPATGGILPTDVARTSSNPMTCHTRTSQPPPTYSKSGYPRRTRSG
ncbi:hypothetical protein [Streptomyces sp. NPDC059455]|uniref:hypothetical protein n=1 Tax=Streptomyces sp. NPDC059455 TaxID=3346837 RepID=UPI0036C428EA